MGKDKLLRETGYRIPQVVDRKGRVPQIVDRKGRVPQVVDRKDRIPLSEDSPAWNQ